MCFGIIVWHGCTGRVLRRARISAVQVGRCDGFGLAGQGGYVDELEGCARSADITALYALSEGEFVSYILGAPGFVTQPFRDLFGDGLPLMTPLVARSEGPPGGR